MTSGALGSHDDLSEKAWRFAGHDLRNTRSAPAEHQLAPGNVAGLTTRWVYTTHGDVSATPSVDDGALYVPDWGGYLAKVKTKTGQAIWERKVSDYNGITGGVSRTSPAIVGDKLIIGGQAGAHVIAVAKDTGDLLWKTQLDDHVGALITQSPVVFGDKVYVGVSSREEALALDPNYHCCSFRGSVAALDVKTGAVLWKSYTVPSGYSGGAVWSNTAAVDPKRHSLYVATGNNYTVPAAVAACIEAAAGDARKADACLAKDDYLDAVIALDLDTGAIRWGHRLQGADTYTIACLFGKCSSFSPDYDFGSGPNLFTVGSGKERHDLLGAGQKSGIYWALDPADGHIVWGTLVGPGSSLGGIEFGTATDGQRIYAAVSNIGKKEYKLLSGQTITYGAFSALDAATGKILWQTPDPAGSYPLGSVTVANGVMYAEAPSADGPMYAIDAATGAPLWRFNGGGSIVGGPAVVDGTVYWGSGYGRFPFPPFKSGSNKLYAFGLPDSCPHH